MTDPLSDMGLTSAEAPGPGQRIGPYSVLGPLGSGAVGQVLRVKDELGREVALKLFSGSEDPGRLERFGREGQVTATLSHPGIVGVHAAGSHEGRPYLVYELVAGEDLERAWRQLSREQLLLIILEVADAVGYAHTEGVVHRDLKPANVLLDGNGRARVADFGLAQVVGMERLTRSGALVGTLHYMAPEQATGARERYGPHTDVWALGVLTYRALSGRLPFEGATLVELMARVTRAAAVTPRSSDASVSPALDAVCMRALQRDPAGRYPDGAAFAAALRRALAGQAPERSPGQRIRPPGAWAAIAALLVVLGVGGWWWITRSEARGAESAGPSAEPSPEPSASPLAEAWPPIRARLEAGDPRSVRRRVLEVLGSEGIDPAELRGRLVAYGVGEGDAPDPARLSTTLRVLAALSADLPAPTDPREEVALANAGFALAVNTFQAAAVSPEEPGASNAEFAAHAAECRERLETLGRAGLRPTSTLAPQFAETVLSLSRFGVLVDDDYWRLVRALVSLDLPLHHDLFTLNLLNLQGGSTRPWRIPPERFWDRYVEDRIALHGAESERAAKRLLALVSQPGQLGPVQRAQTAFLLTDHVPDPERPPLLELAVELAPQLPTARGRLALLVVRDGGFEEGLALIERALECFVEQNYDGMTHLVGLKNNLDSTLVLALAGLGKREAAREVYRGLVTRGANRAGRLRSMYPWLGE